MKRYYNENPQVMHWMEKCAVLQQKLDLLVEDYNTLEEGYNFWKVESLRLEQRAQAAFKHFNSLPWYKKMFFKFEI